MDVSIFDEFTTHADCPARLMTGHDVTNWNATAKENHSLGAARTPMSEARRAHPDAHSGSGKSGQPFRSLPSLPTHLWQVGHE